MAKKKQAKRGKASDEKVEKSRALTAATELSPAEQQEAERRWKLATSELLKRHSELMSRTLQYYYDVGKLADEVAASQGQGASGKGRFKYGQRTLAELAAAIDCSPSSVYNCLRFFRMTDKKKLDELQKNGWAFRNALQLTTVEDADVREKFQQDFQGGKYMKPDGTERDSEAFRQAVLKYNARQRAEGTRNDNRGNKLTLLSPIKSAHAAVHKVVQEVLPDLLVSMKELGEAVDKIDPAKAAEARKQLRAINKDLAAVGEVQRRYIELASEFDLL